MTAHEIIESLEKHRLTVDEFLMLDRENAFGWKRTELFDGEVFYMSPKHRPHALAATDMAIALHQALVSLSNDLTVLLDVSIRIGDHYAPEPDIVITDEPDGDGILPVGNVALVAEVSDTTQKIDLGPKAILYAEAGIAEYWVLDVMVGMLHQMWSPSNGTYTQSRQIDAGEMIVAETIDGLTIRLPA
jgi:Uma2 family endonuclease